MTVCSDDACRGLARIATMNIEKSLASKVLAVTAAMQSFALDLLCIQEADINTVSWSRVVSSFKAQGFHLIGGPEVAEDGPMRHFRRCVIVTREPARSLTLQGITAPDRVAAAVIEVRLRDEIRKVVVASTYGHGSCREQATRHHVEVLTALSSLGCEWLLLGDFNVTLDEDPAALGNCNIVLVSGEFGPNT
eukprot:s13206_g1.t1